MAGSMYPVARTALLTVLLGLGFVPISIAGVVDVKRQSPIVETRMWTPQDIESLFQEWKAREKAGGSPYWSNEDSLILKAVKSPVFTTAMALSPLGLIDGWLNKALPTTETTPPDSVIMRNVAYDILRTWPRSRAKVGQYIGMNVPGTEEAIYGKPFLKWFYGVFRRQKLRIKSFEMGTAYFEQQYAEWVKEWGPDPAVAPSHIPDGYVPEEFDGKWYLSVKLESKKLFYYACLEKSGHVFGRWDATNTRARSHIGSKALVMICPYPVQMRFSLSRRWAARWIRFSDDVMQAKGRRPWQKLIKRRYRGPSGRPPHVSYGFEYPIYDFASRRWLPAKAVLSSAPGPEYQEVLAILDGFQNQGQKGMATDLRSWAGDYRKAR